MKLIRAPVTTFKLFRVRSLCGEHFGCVESYDSDEEVSLAFHMHGLILGSPGCCLPVIVECVLMCDGCQAKTSFSDASFPWGISAITQSTNDISGTKRKANLNATSKRSVYLMRKPHDLLCSSFPGTWTMKPIHPIVIELCNRTIRASTPPPLGSATLMTFNFYVFSNNSEINIFYDIFCGNNKPSFHIAVLRDPIRGAVPSVPRSLLRALNQYVHFNLFLFSMPWYQVLRYEF